MPPAKGAPEEQAYLEECTGLLSNLNVADDEDTRQTPEIRFALM
jgi:hypothetical protein